MKKYLRLCGVVIVVLGLATTAVSAPLAQTSSAWFGAYYNNRDLQGEPMMTRQDANIDFNWGGKAPDARLPATDFSVRWTRWFYIDTPGVWTFTTLTDDGARLFIDDALVLDAWNEQPATTRSVTLSLTQSFHLIRLEYFQHVGDSQAHLFIISPDYPDWRGQYFNNVEMTGAPVFVRNDIALKFDFGNGGPGGNVSGANFSARWTRSQFFAAGRYRFTTTTDDGTRLWIDGQLVIDQWRDQMVKSWTADVTLGEGVHWIQMDYFQRGGTASAQLTWVPVTGSGEMWHGEFFDNASVTGNAVLTRDEGAINFDWKSDSPGKGISKNGDWSTRWTSKRTVTLPGFYSVSAIADDGVRVWVDNNLVIDQWHDQSPTTYAAMIYLTAGQHDWRVEHYQHTGAAALRVEIAPGTAYPEPLTLPSGLPSTDLAVDTKSVAFITNSDGAWKTAANGYGGMAYWTNNNAFTQANSNWARWYAGVPRAGKYEIYAYVPGNLATSRSVRYVISHADTFDIRALNQALYVNQWVSIGTYYFAATGDEYVTLNDVTYETPQSTVIVADALLFAAR